MQHLLIMSGRRAEALRESLANIAQSPIARKRKLCGVGRCEVQAAVSPLVGLSEGACLGPRHLYGPTTDREWRGES
jgi:hypothetical protein